jgi:2,6-dihydroxypyridine 3-monooxygenase
MRTDDMTSLAGFGGFSTRLRVAVAGGSMGGLTTALLLRDVGHDVAVFERSTAALTGYGAGIVAHEASLRYLVERTNISIDELTVPVSRYRLFDSAARLLYEEPVGYRFAGWGRLYRELLELFGHDRYHQGEALVGFDAAGNGVKLRFAGGQTERCDLLVLADGIQSTGRRRLFPHVEPRYAGYVAWRGTVPEVELSDVLSTVDDAITYAVIESSHILVYPIPAADGSNERGRRIWNFVWYRNIEPGPALDELMTDRDGFQQAISLHPGRVQDRYVRALKHAAAEMLPRFIAEVVLRTREPFVQVVVDVECPRMAVGRICILGDAAFAARPHAAAGTAKAAENAWTLAEAIESASGDLEDKLEAWSDEQTLLGKRLVERSRQIGEGSQFRCDWRPGDPGLRFGLYEAGDSSIWERRRTAWEAEIPRPVRSG